MYIFVTLTDKMSQNSQQVVALAQFTNVATAAKQNTVLLIIIIQVNIHCRSANKK